MDSSFGSTANHANAKGNSLIAATTSPIVVARRIPTVFRLYGNPVAPPNTASAQWRGPTGNPQFNTIGVRSLVYISQIL